jgi:lipoyl(octanoyl) transferase
VKREAWSVQCGLVPYADALAVQRAMAGARREGRFPDTLLLLEHPPVYTKGRRHDPAELPMGEDWYRMQGIEICETDRGGRVTYHGPGQLVGYPIVDLANYGDDVHEFVRRLERVMLGALEAAGVPCQVIDGLTGIWTLGEPPIPEGTLGPQGTPVGAARGSGEARKVGAIGVHVSKGVTTHGFAVNVANDLQPFEWIVPCGIEAARATSLTRELGAAQDLGAFAATVRDTYARVFGVDVSARESGAVASVVPEAAALGAAAVPLS